MPPSLLALVFLIVGAGSPQAPSQAPDLALLIGDLPAAAHRDDMMAAVSLSQHLASAPIEQVQADLPALMALTESTEGPVRSLAVLSLTGLEGIRESKPTPIDTERLSLLTPYLPRLAPRLLDPTTAPTALILFDALALIRPVPDQLTRILIQTLDAPGSTQPIKRASGDMIPAFGIVRAVVDVGATFHSNPVTHIAEGTDSPEVRTAILRFLHRPDQTPRSLVETIRCLAHAQPQNPEVNANLLRFLDSADPAIRMELVHALPSLTLPPADFTAAKEKLARIAADSSTPSELTVAANSILPCWTNDRHHPCP